jgi:serine/threonine protein kinase
VVDKKTFKSSSSDQHIQREQLICEIFAKELKHKNIVNVYDVFIEQDDTIYIVMDYIQGGELFDKIKYSNGLPEPTARRWFKEIVEAVEYIHSVSYIYV